MNLNTNLDNTLLDVNAALFVVANPGNTLATKSTNAHTEDTTKDGVSGRNGETKTGSHGEVTSRSNDGANHAQHEKSRAIIKSRDIDNLSSNGVGDSTANTKSASELHDTGTDHGLKVADGPRGHGRSPRVGDIVGTDVPSVEEGKDCAYREEVVILSKDCHCCV